MQSARRWRRNGPGERAFSRETNTVDTWRILRGDARGRAKAEKDAERAKIAEEREERRLEVAAKREADRAAKAEGLKPAAPSTDTAKQEEGAKKQADGEAAGVAAEAEAEMAAHEAGPPVRVDSP